MTTDGPPRLASADNFRDATGPGLTNADGVPLRAGVLYRSNELTLSDDDLATVASLGLTAVYDLRDDTEVAAKPDPEVPGATYRHLEVRGIPHEVGASWTRREDAVAALRAVYAGFVTEPDRRAPFGVLLREVAHGTGPSLVHCTAGKDRTGWACALVLHVLGVSRADVLEQYLLTNTVSSATREHYLAMVEEHLGADRRPVFEATLMADESYLAAAYDAADATYGSLDGYLADGLGLDDATLAALQARFNG